jgi:uncharacterized OB-fold protein
MECKLTFTEYNKALKGNHLLGLRCHDCGTINVPPRITCRKCAGTTMEIVELTGRGKIKTFTVVYVASGARQEKSPLIVVLVELDEGPWIMGNLGGIDFHLATMELIGKRVKMGDNTPENNDSFKGESVPLFMLWD